MRPLSYILLMAALPCQAFQPDSTSVAEKEDTLKMVVVTAHARPPVVKAIERSLKEHEQPRVKTLGEFLNERFPTLMDCIMHPFAFKERRRERRQKRLKRILRDYELTKTPNELLMEAIRNEQLRDSLSNAR